MTELERATYTSSIDEFKRTLLERLRLLAGELGLVEFSMPIALALVLPPEEGGSAMALEMVNRFRLLDLQSKKAIDFYFLGWRNQPLVGGGTKAVFQLEDFSSCLDRLGALGVGPFHGSLDLILCDARLSRGRVSIGFNEAMQIDVARFVADSKQFSLGSFLQELVTAAGAVREASLDGGATVLISDRLGLAVAGRSLLSYVFKKWGEYVGAEELAKLTTRRLGPDVDLAKL